MKKKLLFLVIFFVSFFFFSDKAFAICRSGGDTYSTGAQTCVGFPYTTGRTCTTSTNYSTCQSDGTWLTKSCGVTNGKQTYCNYNSVTDVSCLAISCTKYICINYACVLSSTGFATARACTDSGCTILPPTKYACVNNACVLSYTGFDTARACTDSGCTSGGGACVGISVGQNCSIREFYQGTDPAKKCVQGTVCVGKYDINDPNYVMDAGICKGTPTCTSTGISAGGNCDTRNATGTDPSLKCLAGYTCVATANSYDAASAGTCVLSSSTSEGSAPPIVPDCKLGNVDPADCIDGTYVIPTCKDGICKTAIGPLSTNYVKFVKDIFSVLLALVGGISVLLIIISGYKLIASRGNPEQVKGAQEQFTAAIVGLLFVIFSLVFLEVIGISILGLPITLTP